MSYVVIGLLALAAIKLSGVFFHLLFGALRPFGMLIAGFFLGAITMGTPNPSALKSQNKAPVQRPENAKTPNRSVSPTMDFLDKGVSLADRAVEEASVLVEEYSAGLNLSEIIERFFRRNV